MVQLIFLVPLLCWALAARHRRLDLKVAGVLALIAVCEVMVSLGWILQGWSVTLTVALTAATVIVLIYGLVKRRSANKAQPYRRSGRSLAGVAAAVVYCVLATVAVWFAVVAYGVNGLPATVPPSSGVLPLPAGLAVADDRDEGCGSGSATVCSREIDVVGSPGMSAADVVQRVRAHLETGRGWRLQADNAGWGACRTAGWLLDRRHECVDVVEHDGRAVVQLEESDRW